MRKPYTLQQTREQWLASAVTLLGPLFKSLAQVDLPPVAVSCGRTGRGLKSKSIGECWTRAASSNGINEIFISPKLDDGMTVLGTLAHELIHASDDCASGHKHHFADVARLIGLEGKMTATVVGDALRARLDKVLRTLGDYPHAAMRFGDGPTKKQPTRLIKCQCTACGYTVRTTAMWIDQGLPTCCCGTEMQVAV